MKKLTGLYSQIVSKENLYRSAYMAARSRRYRDSVADFNFLLEEEIEKLHRELTDKTYRHGKYRVFNVYDPKERKIAAAPFRDRVVHHAVHDVIEPFIDRTFIYDSYACRKDKGSHKALDRAQRFLKSNRFCLHADVKKFFPSIDRGILKSMLAKRITDEPLLRLINGIIDSARQIAENAGGGG
ncbi:MAG: reverse transcriptase domain-containing protein [Candidatus Omnitrophica bacterium]|nr:reverse transcriptase domain-containing protein [Candidatus Omnitrophota bacterium]